MHDTEVVASIVAGDPVGVAQAYDRYADPLYKYCRSILGDPAHAADAVQDTFVIAASRLRRLRDAQRLRAWLYAVARNECLRIARDKKVATALDDAPQVTDEGGHVGDDADRADLPTLVENATRGLNPTEREAIELQLRQGLEPAEIAIVLGVSRDHVYSLLSRARDQLLTCLAVLLVSRAGRGDCPGLADLLSGWDGRLSVPLRKRVHQHIDSCAVCTARRAFEMRPAMMLGLSPGAAIVAVAAESVRSAASPPAALRAHTLALAVDGTPTAIAHRAAVLSRAGSFRRHGFPKPARVPAAPGRGTAGSYALRSPARRRVSVTAGVALTAAAAAVAAFVLAGNAGHGTVPAGKSPGPASVVAAGTADATAPPTGTAGRHQGASAKPTAARTGLGSRTPASTASPSPSTTPTSTASPSPTSASPAPSPPATLAVSPAGGQLTVPRGGATITLTARGGGVSWSITLSGGSGHVTVEPSAGTLRGDGDTVSVTIYARHLGSGRGLTVNPGGAEFTLVTGGGGSQAGSSQAETGIPPLISSDLGLVTLPYSRIVSLDT